MTTNELKKRKDFKNYRLNSTEKKKIKGGDGDGIIDDEVLMGKTGDDDDSGSNG